MAKARTKTSTRAKAAKMKPGKSNGKARNTTAVRKAYTKTELLADLSDSTGIGRKEIGSLLIELANVVERHVKRKAIGSFTLPGLLKIKTRKIPAKKARKNVPNPFKPGELMDVKAKPACTKVKILPLKGLKAMVE